MKSSGEWKKVDSGNAGNDKTIKTKSCTEKTTHKNATR